MARQRCATRPAQPGSAVSAGGGADQLREHRKKATRHVDVLLELAQDRGERAGVDVVGVQIAPDLLEGELGDAEQGAHAAQAGAGAAGHRAVALLLAIRTATVSQPWCQAKSKRKAC